ncbi:MAG: UDP-N-acetylmuramate dehydrogenase [Clostridia bacterium]
MQLLKYGGPADIFVKVNDTEELKFLLNVAKENNVQITVIGNGSNVLVKDKGIRGVVVKLNFNDIIKEDNETLKVGSGVLLSKLARVALEEEITGIEFASGIPGSFGGAIYMNSGAYGNEIADRIISTTYIDENLEIKTITKEEQEFSYRKSIFQKNNWIILGGKIKLEKGNKEAIKSKIEEYSKSRKEKQPLNMPNAGSIFKRGESFITAQLIDKCGLKGYRIGDAEVSTLHAGFIVNKGNATSEDVLKLIQYIQEKVKEKFNVDIEPEIRILGVD